MRRLLVFLLALAATISAVAQEPATLTLSKSAFAVKITNWEKQLRDFAPLFDRIDELITTASPEEKTFTATLNEGMAKFKKVPGLDTTGEFWFVSLPPTAPAANKDAAVTPPAMVLLAPLNDPQAFKTFLASDSNTKNAMSQCKVFGKYALLAMPGKILPDISGITVDLQTMSKRDIVMYSNYKDFNPASLNFLKMDGQAAMAMGPLSTFFGVFSSYISDVLQNVETMEIGLAMVDDTLSFEMITLPRTGSPLAQSLADPAQSTLALELAGCLPENLAYCSAGGSQLPGLPGFGNIFLRIMTGMSGMALSTERQQALTQQFNLLAAQCSQGRAIGLTAPPANEPGDVALVGVYHVVNNDDAKAAIAGFVHEVVLIRDTVAGGQLADVVNIQQKPAVGKVGDTTVDGIKVTFNVPEKPFTIDIFLAYLGDKMLFTAGDGGKKQMVDMITRIREAKTTGFTSSKRFIALKAGLPETIRGFESYATLDICRAGVNFAPIDITGKKSALKMLGIFPTQRTVINSYTTCRDNQVYSEFRIPGEQIDFFFSGIKAFFTARTETKPVVQNGNAQ